MRLIGQRSVTAGEFGPRPLQSAAVPRGPEQLVRGRAPAELVAEYRQRPGEHGRAPRLTRVDEVELERPAHGRHEQLATGALPARGELDVAQRRAQPPQLDRVEAPAGSDERLGHVVEGPVVAGGQVDDAQQVAHRRQGAERAARAARPRRHLAGGQLRLEGRDLTRVVRDHGALRPRDAVVHMALAEQARDRVVLLGGRSERERSHRCIRLRLGRAASMRDDADGTDALSHLPDELVLPGRSAVRRREHGHAAEAGREPREVLGGGAAERAGADVGVAEGDHRDAAGAAGLEHLHAAQSELLRVVHEDHRDAVGDLGARRGGAQHADGLAHQARGIPMRTAHVGAHLQVLVEERRHRPPHRDRVGVGRGCGAGRTRCPESCTPRRMCAPRCGSPSSTGRPAAATPASGPGHRLRLRRRRREGPGSADPHRRR